MATEAYAIIAKTAMTITNDDATTSNVAAGTVINRVLWDGVTEWSPPIGTEARADPDGTLQIGQTTTV